MKTFRLIAALLLAALALSGCSVSAEPRWRVGTGPIKIVASTNVWGSVANLVAGDLATVDAIIYNTNQDPHSYELSARDQLIINNADIVIMNGGGYDDFMQKAVDADPTPAITVDAFMASGDDETRNEHVWYDIDQVGDVAAVIGAAIESMDETKFDEIEARVTEFREKIESQRLKLEALRASPKNVFLTEPLIAYLVEDAGYQDLTPPEFSQAVEEERDIPADVIAKSMNLIRDNRVDAIYVNSSTKTPQTNMILTANPDVPIFEFGELITDGNYFDLLNAAINKLGEK